MSKRIITLNLTDLITWNISSITVGGSIGSFKKYWIGKDWSVNSVKEEEKVAVLLILRGEQAYKILRDLYNLVLPKAKPCNDLCKILRNNLST